MRGSDYVELRILAAVVDGGGVSRAARVLGMSPSAVSQAIRRLEARIGVQLLMRSTRSVRPTDAAVRLLARIAPAFSEMDAAVAEAAHGSDAVTGTLRLNALRLGAEQLLRRDLAGFLAAHPGITIDLVVDEQLVDIVAGGFDAGIRLGEGLENDMVALQVGGRQRMRVVASPAYLARHGAPREPADLSRHRCVNLRRPSDGTPYRWEFERDGRTFEVAVPVVLVADDTGVVARAAIDGAGPAFLFESDIAGALADGRLRSLLDDWTPPFPGCFLYYPRGNATRPALRALIDWIKARQS